MARIAGVNIPTNKRVIIAVARGLLYGSGTPNAPGEHLVAYLRWIFGYMGIAKDKNYVDLTEEAKVAVRNIRRDANEEADQGEKDKDLTEDQRDEVKGEIQEMTNNPSP